jgi:ribosome maturation factor RimP
LGSALFVCANTGEILTESPLAMTGFADGPREARFVRETGLAAEIAALAEPVIEELGYRLVRVAITGDEDPTVQVMAERPDGTMTVKDCTAITRNLSPLMDAHDPLAGTYFLEVSSPGIARPLVRPSDFEAWVGYEARIELKEMTDGRRRFRGRIEGVTDGEVRLETKLPDYVDPQVLGIAVETIGEARLIQTEELIRNSLKRGKQAGNSTKPAEAADERGE